MSAPLLEAKKVTKVFRSGLIQRSEKVALENFSLTVDPTQPTILSVVGESGSGKSTMARLLLGLEQPTSGTIHYKGNNLSELSGRKKGNSGAISRLSFKTPLASSTLSIGLTMCSRCRFANLPLPKARARHTS
jgi:ABC-type oligopeptide transport system ATPase subunit